MSSDPERELAGRTALVTGAAGNIGRAIAVLLAGQGAHVALADRPDALNALAETGRRCEAAGGTSIVTPFDVTDDVAVVAAVSALAADVGPPELVVNNAGYQGRFDNVISYDLDNARRVFDVNVIGVFSVLQACASALRDHGLPGSIVNTASMAGVSGAPNMPAYSASKAAVIGLTKSAAKDLAPFGIRVNAISPGFIGPGAMWENQVAQQAAAPSRYYADDPTVVADQMINQIPLARYGSLEEVAAAALFLLSDAASYITGVNLEISGGAA